MVKIPWLKMMLKARTEGDMSSSAEALVQSYLENRKDHSFNSNSNFTK